MLVDLKKLENIKSTFYLWKKSVLNVDVKVPTIFANCCSFMLNSLSHSISPAPEWTERTKRPESNNGIAPFPYKPEIFPC